MPVEGSPGLTLDFLRHGIATDPQPDQEDELRSLTPAGEKRTRQVAQRLKRLGWQWPIVLTSPLRRAQQTATIFQEETLTPSVEIFHPLAPGGRFHDLEIWMQQHPELTGFAVVGHQPDLSRWILSALLGDPIPGESAISEGILLKKAGLARVEFREGRHQPGQLSLLLTPKVLLDDLDSR
ncbi:MAG: phosphohistidine phosphatase SixA [Cyanobacteriota bacterium]|nr:phosphohistidine phosphatase SixA [Cyanobacteriota bacterium]